MSAFAWLGAKRCQGSSRSATSRGRSGRGDRAAVSPVWRPPPPWRRSGRTSLRSRASGQRARSSRAWPRTRDGTARTGESVPAWPRSTHRIRRRSLSRGRCERREPVPQRAAESGSQTAAHAEPNRCLSKQAPLLESRMKSTGGPGGSYLLCDWVLQAFDVDNGPGVRVKAAASAPMQTESQRFEERARRGLTVSSGRKAI